MINVMDRVYHKGIHANGIVTEVDNSKQRDKYKVVFHWAKYCDVKNGSWSDRVSSTARKWQWCSEDNLIVTHMPPRNNKVTMIGNRSLDRLLRSMIEIDRRRHRDGSDIIINYGVSNHTVSQRIPMVNRTLMMDKYMQQQAMGDEIGITSCQVRSGEPVASEWIIKPKFSIGGRGITEDHGNGLNHDDYYQRKFNKVREFRGHCFLWNTDNPTIMIQEKKVEDQSQLCWNEKQGSKFFTPYSPLRGYHKLEREDPGLAEHINDVCIEALKAVRYDFGGVDIGMDTAGNLKVFEVNSRMGLKERSCFIYKQMFWKLFTLDINTYKQERGF
jgi:hypothetical protein